MDAGQNASNRSSPLEEKLTPVSPYKSTHDESGLFREERRAYDEYWRLLHLS